MPYYHHPRTFTPLSIAADKRATKNGLRHAIFTSRFDRYVGDWKNDLKDGKGRFLTIGGMLYEGDWLKGYRHGFGLLSRRNENGTFTLVYRGEWVRGKQEGPGWMYYDNGNVYLGFFKRNKKSGYGNMWYADNTFYGGYWKNDVRDGLGLFLLENGCRYEGHWEKGIKSGIGRYYHMNTGQIQEGCWVDDICVKSKMADIIIRQACVMPTPYPIPEGQVGTLQWGELSLPDHGKVDRQKGFIPSFYNFTPDKKESSKVPKSSSRRKRVVDDVENRRYRQKPPILHRPNVISVSQVH